ncbi:MAG: hypothetical protein B7Z37_18350 [Verrucomicrobia bacterium 12-59-8]|nr:MAG: hypothetical protein B7Z37_18350 [Verrucomicrobia bacterium 12-59-8]
MFEKLPGPRHTVSEQADGLVFRIPAKRNAFVVGFLTLWLCGWFVGEFTVPFALLHAVHKNPANAAFLLVWLCAWTVGGAFVIYIWLWQLKGSEVITVSPTALSIKREVLGFGRTKHYDVAEIHQLRVAPFTFNPFEFRSGMAMWGLAGGALAFDYGFKTFRFGAGLDEAEARIILQTITSRVPRLSNVTTA